MNSNSKDHETEESPETTPPSRNLTTPPASYPREGPERFLMIRYGKMQHRGLFRCRTPGLVYNDRVVVQSERGIEIGEIVLDAQKTSGKVSGKSSQPGGREVVGWVLHKANEEELKDHGSINEPCTGPGPEFLFCKERIQALKLPMRLVDVERPFKGGKIIFYFTADGRVDFRALVRDLAKRYRTRIEMKQIGVRDEAKVLGGLADCGRELCCRGFLTKLQPINMRMAKVQKTTLDPAKISGRCGRLKCCLRYEYDAYLSFKANLPRIGAAVLVEEKQGTVVGMDVLSQKVIVLFETGERLNLPLDQIEVVTYKESGPPATGAAKGEAAAGKERESTESKEFTASTASTKSTESPPEDTPAVTPETRARPEAPTEEKRRPPRRRSGRRRGSDRSEPRYRDRGQGSGAESKKPDAGVKRDDTKPGDTKRSDTKQREGGNKRGRRRRRKGRPRKSKNSQRTPGTNSKTNSKTDGKKGGGDTKQA